MASRTLIVLLACVSAALGNPCGGLVGNGLIGNGLGLGLGNGLGLGLGNGLGLGLGNGLGLGLGAGIGPILGNGLLALGPYGNLPIATGYGNAGLIGNGVVPDAIIAPHNGPQIAEIINPVPNPYAATFAPTLIPVSGPIVGPTGHIGFPGCGPIEIAGPISPAVEFVAPVANNVFWGNNWNNGNGWNNCGGVVGPVIAQAGVPVLNQIAQPPPFAAVAPAIAPLGFAGYCR